MAKKFNHPGIIRTYSLLAVLMLLAVCTFKATCNITVQKSPGLYVYLWNGNKAREQQVLYENVPDTTYMSDGQTIISQYEYDSKGNLVYSFVRSSKGLSDVKTYLPDGKSLDWQICRGTKVLVERYYLDGVLHWEQRLQANGDLDKRYIGPNGNLIGEDIQKPDGKLILLTFFDDGSTIQQRQTMDEDSLTEKSEYYDKNGARLRIVLADYDHRWQVETGYDFLGNARHKETSVDGTLCLVEDFSPEQFPAVHHLCLDASLQIQENSRKAQQWKKAPEAIKRKKA